MVSTAFTMFSEVDVILFLIEATSDEIGRGDRRILDKIVESRKPCILIINKIDLIKRDKLLKLIDLYRKEYDFEAVIPISATKKDGVETIIQELVNLLPEGPKYYSDEEYTDQTVRQISEEIIREKALKIEILLKVRKYMI